MINIINQTPTDNLTIVSNLLNTIVNIFNQLTYIIKIITIAILQLYVTLFILTIVISPIILLIPNSKLKSKFKAFIPADPRLAYHFLLTSIFTIYISFNFDKIVQIKFFNDFNGQTLILVVWIILLVSPILKIKLNGTEVVSNLFNKEEEKTEPIQKELTNINNEKMKTVDEILSEFDKITQQEQNRR